MKPKDRRAYEQIKSALEPFARAYRLNKQISDGWPDSKPAREIIAGSWPTWSDLRSIDTALTIVQKELDDGGV